MARIAAITDQQILDAARNAFLAEGFQASTIEIARRAGVLCNPSGRVKMVRTHRRFGHRHSTNWVGWHLGVDHCWTHFTKSCSNDITDDMPSTGAPLPTVLALALPVSPDSWSSFSIPPDPRSGHRA